MSRDLSTITHGDGWQWPNGKPSLCMVRTAPIGMTPRDTLPLGASIARDMAEGRVVKETLTGERFDRRQVNTG